MIEIDNCIPNPTWFDYQDFYDKVVEEMPFGGVFVEVGTYHGRSAIYLALKMLSSTNRFKIITIENLSLNPSYRVDPEIVPTSRNTILQNFKTYGVGSHINLMTCDSLKTHMTNVDWVFLDCTVNYQYETDHIKHWLPKIKKGGVISGHDYELHEGVHRAVNEMFRDVSTMGMCWYVQV
jgi:predicted O-methyltransferase YrrM